MLYREMIVVCSEIHTKHIITLCGQNVELLSVKLVEHIVTTVPHSVKSHAYLGSCSLELEDIKSLGLGAIWNCSKVITTLP